MKKIIVTIIIIAMLCPVTSVSSRDLIGNKAYHLDGSQTDVTTSAAINGQNGGNGELNPIIKVKWEYDMDATCHDSDPCTEHLQVAPIVGQTVTVGYFAVVTSPYGIDPNPNALGYVSVYADLWHPDGQYKYQIELMPVGWDGNSYDKTAALAAWEHVTCHHQDLISVNQNWTTTLPPGTDWYQDVYDELNEGLALLYFTTAEISYCQPGGYYLVGDTAFDKLGNQAEYLYDNFWYVPTSAVQIDFSSVDYSPIHIGIHKVVGGDTDMTTPTKPTVRNIGNTPVILGVNQSDMGFGKTSGNWNVQFDARLSVNGDYVYYYPNECAVIPGVLQLCTCDKLDFSILATKGVSGVQYSGWMKIYAYIDMDSYIWITPSQFVNQPPSGVPDFNLTRPTASFTYNPQNPKDTDTIQFTDTSTDTFGIIQSWSWNFGDGTTSTLQNPTHKYADDGIYQVTLNITDDYAKKSTKSELITVENVPPVADFTYSPLGPTTDDTIVFTDASTDTDGTVVSWSWNFGDGTTSTLQNTTHKYVYDGEYIVTLTISDDDGGTNVKPKLIEVDRGSTLSGLIADFTYSPPNPTTANNIVFTDASIDTDGTIVTWSWNFGDGATSTLQNPTHKYTNDGAYTVTLTIYDDNSASDTVSKSVHVGSLVADFTYSPPNPIVDDTIVFIDTSTDSAGTIVSWSWNFGDGATSALQNPTHKYDIQGTYLITLSVTDNNGNTNAKSKSIEVDMGNTVSGPVADFTYSPTNPTTDDTVTFTDTSTDTNGTIISWSWNFGDGATSTLQNPTHKYADEGAYTVTLTINDGSTTNTISKTVNVDNVPPVADFNYNPTNPKITDTIQFTDLSTDSDGTVVSWSWNFGDGATSTLQNPTHKYTAEGAYTVTLTVYDDDSATNEISKSVHVGVLVADFTYSPTSPTTDDTVTFTDTSTDSAGTIVIWSWDFGDGAISAFQNPTHRFTSAGNYSVTLLVVDNNSTTDTQVKIIQISEPNTPPLTPPSPPSGGEGSGGSNGPTVNDLPPTADANGPYYGLVNETITFDGAGSNDSDGSITSYNWSFGDGTEGSGINTTHKYSTTGNFTVNLTVTDNDGKSDTNTTYAIINEEQTNNKPTANFTFSPTNPTTDDTVQFTDTSTDSDGTIVSWSWEFGDGTNSTEMNPTHIFKDAGDYLVFLEVTDNDGSTNITHKLITVEGSNTAELTGTTSGNTNGLTGSFWFDAAIIVILAALILFWIVFGRKKNRKRKK